MKITRNIKILFKTIIVLAVFFGIPIITALVMGKSVNWSGLIYSWVPAIITLDFLNDCWKN